MIDIGGMLKTFIYLISSSLLYPVLLLLVVLTIATIIAAGAFFAEWLERVRIHPCRSQDFPQLLHSGDYAPCVSYKVKHFIRELASIELHTATAEVALENLLQESTWKLWKSMDRYRMLVRVAPSLGLIGTLIPMGTGLAALGQGDMTKLTTDLVIAFTTTVVGLAIGTISFFFYTVRRRWIEEDVKNMELAAEMLAAENESTQDEILADAA